MQLHLYKEMADLEDKHWWFTGRKKIIEQVLCCLPNTPVNNVLDIGFGTGGMCETLGKISRKIVAIEPSPAAVAFAREKCSQAEVWQGEISNYPGTTFFDLVTMFDVLEHISDDAAVLKMVYQKLKPGGHFVFTVPAYKFLWSRHDVAHQHFRRYSKNELHQLFTGNSHFLVERLTYFNTLFFPVVLLVRLMKAVIGGDGSDLTILPEPLNFFLGWFFGLERYLLKFFDLPFGVSILCVARKI